MKILYGTKNTAKLNSMRPILKELNIDIIGLNDLNEDIPDIDESGNNPLENAKIKALTYYNMFKIPVFSCDSGLYFDNLPEDIQPGVHVRNVAGNRLSDDEMIEYYSGLAKKYGNITARYKNAICLITGKNSMYQSMDDDLSGKKFIITDSPHIKRVPGFPIDSLSIHIQSGKYYYDLKNREADEGISSGFIKFFTEIFNALPHKN